MGWDLGKEAWKCHFMSHLCLHGQWGQRAGGQRPGRMGCVGGGEACGLSSEELHQ